MIARAEMGSEPGTAGFVRFSGTRRMCECARSAVHPWILLLVAACGNERPWIVPKTHYAPQLGFYAFLYDIVSQKLGWVPRRTYGRHVAFRSRRCLGRGIVLFSAF